MCVLIVCVIVCSVVVVVQVHTAPFRLTPVSSETARLRIVHVPDSVPVAGEGLEVMVQASDASGAVLDMPDLKVTAEMGLKSERSACPLPAGVSPKAGTLQAYDISLHRSDQSCFSRATLLI